MLVIFFFFEFGRDNRQSRHRGKRRGAIVADWLVGGLKLSGSFFLIIEFYELYVFFF